MADNDVQVQVHFLEPNNDSPLNAHAAELWSQRAQYKKLLLEKYDTEVRGKEHTV